MSFQAAPSPTPDHLTAPPISANFHQPVFIPSSIVPRPHVVPSSTLMVNNVDPGFCEDDVASIFKSARGLTKTKIISKGEHITAMLQFMVRFFFL